MDRPAFRFASWAHGSIVQSFQYFVAGFDFIHGFDHNTQYKIAVYLNQGITHLAIGFVLILSAPTLAALVYARRATHGPVAEDKA